MNEFRAAILIGNGIRNAGRADLAPKLLELGVPVVASWQAKDLLDSDHPLFMGCSGLYGNRAANIAIANATQVYCIGNRRAIWNVGYEGLKSYKEVPEVNWDLFSKVPFGNDPWAEQCMAWKRAHPWLESPTHDDTNGFINSYRFFDRMTEYFAPDEQVTIDCGSACASAFQVMRVRPPQRLYSSGGLGEMGCALPAAIGVSFARNKGRVISIVGDGAMMLNLQELQTIVHHQLPIKIFVAVNDCYMMIRKTQKLAGMAYSGVNSNTGVSCPDFRRLALSFGITAAEVRTWEDFERIVPGSLSSEGPVLVEYHMDPNQLIYPKLDPMRDASGKVSSPPFDRMSPVLA